MNKQNLLPTMLESFDSFAHLVLLETSSKLFSNWLHAINIKHFNKSH